MAETERKRRPVWLSVLRKAALLLLCFIILITATSLIFNALTQLPATLSAPTGKYINVNGVQVHYRQWGTGGVPLILVHGFLESTVSWDQVAPLLAKDHVVYALDLAGYGYTQYDGQYGLADETRLVDGFIHALHVQKPILIGHSLGAAVIGDVALIHPSDVGGMIFADGDGLPLRFRVSTLRNLIADSPYITSIYRLLLHTSSLDRGIFKNVCGPSCTAVTPQLVSLWLRPLHQSAEEQALMSIIKNGVIGISPQQVASIKVPRAIIWGQYDRTDGGSLTGAITNLHHPKAIIIPNAGHLSMVANPTAFVSAVETETAGMRH